MTSPPHRHRPFRVLAAAAAAFTAAWTVLGSLSDWGAYWVAWIAFGFLAPELYGLTVNTRDTLSWNTWGLEHLNFGHPFDFATWTPLHWATAIVIWLLFGWLSLHIPFALLR